MSDENSATFVLQMSVGLTDRCQMKDRQCTPPCPSPSKNKEHTNPEVPACYKSFPVKPCAIICAPSYKELEKTVNNVLEGHMLRKNPRKQMTNSQRCTPFFPHTNSHLILTGRMV
jgi:hypothetical protein